MTAPQPDAFTDILYKYTDLKCAVNILINQSLRCARASVLNDPFDVLIGDWIGPDAESFFRKGNAILSKMLVDEPERFAAKLQMDADRIKDFAQR